VILVFRFAYRPIFAAVAPDTRPPEAPGGYLEPSSHFFTSSTPSDVFHCAIGVLQAQQVDMIVKQSKFKIKCTAYRSGARLPFVVRVFRVDDKHAVEFQRRSVSFVFSNPSVVSYVFTESPCCAV
jgi:hypothetical protein